MAGADSHYFAARPATASAPRTVTVELGDVELQLTTDRGVFGYGQLDAGSRLLLTRVPTPTGATMLDLGCGAGAIALTMARRATPATVWAVDVNDRAVELCASNAAANRIPNVRAVRPDEVPADLCFDTIWSNPPIRVGKAALHDLLERWLGRLTDGGQAWMVVHRHLGADSLQRWLTDHGHPTTRHASSAGYRILRTTRPPANP